MSVFRVPAQRDHRFSESGLSRNQEILRRRVCGKAPDLQGRLVALAGVWDVEPSDKEAVRAWLFNHHGHEPARPELTPCVLAIGVATVPADDPVPMPVPGTILELPASAVYLSSDRLRMRVKEVADGLPVRRSQEWVTVAG